MSYQGVLAENDGTPFQGDREMTFRLYNAITGGTELWMETQMVSFDGGLFNVSLGSVTNLDLAFDQPYFLGITVEAGDELSPRTAMEAAPYSMNAAKKYALDSRDGNTENMVYAANNKRVGINIQSPLVTLDVRAPGDSIASMFLRAEEWNSEGDYSQIFFGDGNHYIRGEFAKGTTIHDVDQITLTGNSVVIPTSLGIRTNGERPTSRLHVSGANSEFRVHPDFGGTATSLVGTFNAYNTVGALVRFTSEQAPNGKYYDIGTNDSGNFVVQTQGSRSLLVEPGAITLPDDGDIFGLDKVVGFNDLRFYATDDDRPDMIMRESGAVGIGPGWIPNARLSVIGDDETSSDFLFATRAPGNNDVFTISKAGNIRVSGNFTVTNGAKNFALDHPLDPANMTLYHNAVESPGYVTYYNGTVKMDANGAGWVELPDYFEALNNDFHYQLTCVGGFAQVYIGEEIKDNRFRIEGGKPGMKVSWQVTASRADAWAQDHPYEVEVEKTGHEKGKFYYPEGYGGTQADRINSGELKMSTDQ